MKSRGEKYFIRFPKPVAKFYDSLTARNDRNETFMDIAKFLSKQLQSGKLLEIGFGPGRVLENIHKLNKEIELFGIDISKAMVELATENLSGIPVELLEGNIQKTDYAEQYFSVVTCTGSFYLWDKPVESLNEIYRILEANGKVYFYETFRGYDKNDFNRAIKMNLKKENIIKKLIGPLLLRKQLKMTYDIGELESIILKSKFGNKYTIEKVRLGNLDIWVKIILTKRG